MVASRITEEQFMQVLREGLPSGAAMPFRFLSLERGACVIRMTPDQNATRPGGTVAGPVLFGLADLAVYATVMSFAGFVPLAVTTDATMHFLRRPNAVPLIARARLLKEGKRLAVCDVTIAHESEPDAPVAHAVMTYSIPPA